MSTDHSGRFLAHSGNPRIIGRIVVFTALIAGLLPTLFPTLARADDEDWNAWRTATERFEGGNSVYYVHTPPGYVRGSGKRHPLLVILHWSYVNGPAYLHYWRPDSDQHGVIVAAPNSRGGASWVEADGLGIRRMVDEIAQRYDVDPDRVWLAGYSAGGVFVYHLLFKYPDLFSAVLPLGGRIGRHRAEQPDGRAARNARVCLFHGEWDKRYGKGSDAADRRDLEALGYEVEHHRMPRFGHWIPRNQGDAMFRCLNGGLPVRPTLGRRQELADRRARRAAEDRPGSEHADLR